MVVSFQHCNSKLTNVAFKSTRSGIKSQVCASMRIARVYKRTNSYIIITVEFVDQQNLYGKVAGGNPHEIDTVRSRLRKTCTKVTCASSFLGSSLVKTKQSKLIALHTTKLICSHL